MADAPPSYNEVLGEKGTIVHQPKNVQVQATCVQPEYGGAYPPFDGANPTPGGAYPTPGGAYPTHGGTYPPGGAYPTHGGTYPPGGAYPGSGYPPPHIVTATNSNCAACNAILKASYYLRRLGSGGFNPKPGIWMAIHFGIGVFLLILIIVLGIAVPGIGKIPAIICSVFFIAILICSFPNVYFACRYTHTCDEHKDENFTCC